MNRKSFLGRLSAGIVGLVLAPTILNGKEEVTKIPPQYLKKEPTLGIYNKPIPIPPGFEVVEPSFTYKGQVINTITRKLDKSILWDEQIDQLELANILHSLGYTHINSIFYTPMITDVSTWESYRSILVKGCQLI
jgi:hypothetical protein